MIMTKEIPEGYKKTEIGVLPEDWEVVRLGEVAEKIKAGGTPRRSIKSYWGGDIPFVKIEDMSSVMKYLEKTKEKITEDGLKNSSAWIIPPFSILFSMYASIGEVAINKIPVATNQAILAILPKEDIVDLDYLFYSLKYYSILLVSETVQTTQKNVNRGIVVNFEIPLPPLEEQKKIANVLDTIRQAIEVQDNLIKTWKKMKRAVMEKVFREGLHGEELKETEIGKIPKGWEVVSVGEVAEVKYGKAKPKNDNYGKIPVIGSGGIYSYTSKPLISEPTIIIGRKGTAGKVWLILQPCYPSDTTFYLKINREIDISFLFYYLLLIDLSGEEEKTTLPSLQRQHLENLPIPLPPFEEQKQIAQILSTIDKKIEIEQRRKEVLQKLFKSMLHLLMTGKIRVKEVKI